MHRKLIVKCVKGCRDDNAKKYRNKMQYMQAKPWSDDGMRHKKQHEGKGKGSATSA